MPDAANVFNFLQNQGLFLLFKGLLLLLLSVYAVFTIIVVSRVATLNHTLTLAAKHASFIIQLLSIVFFALSVSLFLIALVIV